MTVTIFIIVYIFLIAVLYVLMSGLNSSVTNKIQDVEENLTSFRNAFANHLMKISGQITYCENKLDIEQEKYEEIKQIKNQLEVLTTKIESLATQKRKKHDS